VHPTTAPPPPPALPRRRGPSTLLCLLLCLALLSCVLFSGLVIVELSRYDFEQFDTPRRVDGSPKRGRTDERTAQGKFKGTSVVTFDVFDMAGLITPLQLQLIVSAALGVDERDVAVQDQDSEDIFYRVVVKRVDSGLVQFLNGQSGLQLLNAHAARFDATLFLARAAALVTTASGAQQAGPSTNALTSSKSGSMSSHR